MKASFLFIIALCLLCSCAQTGKKYIIIQEPDRILEYGKYKYSVDKGDVLEITMVKICPDGMRICYEVKNMNTGEYGFVLKDRMEKRHYIFDESSTSEKGFEENIALTNEKTMDLVNRMSALNDLHKKGLIDDKVFEESRAELLDSFLKDSTQEKEKLEGASEESITVKQNIDEIELNEIGKDGTFIAYDDGTILDTKTKIMWWWGSTEQVKNWSDTQFKSKNFRGGGYSDWRVPSIDELKTIYVKSSNNQYKTVDFITLTSPYIISRDFEESGFGDSGPAYIKYIDFKNGKVNNCLSIGFGFASGKVMYLPVRETN